MCTLNWVSGLEIIRSLFTIGTSVITTYFVWKGYQLANKRWGKEAVEFAKKDEEKEIKFHLDQLEKYDARKEDKAVYFQQLMKAGKDEDYVVDIFRKYITERLHYTPPDIKQQVGVFRKNVGSFKP